ncbi:hypothetical protein CYMTET_24002 [Cymbomonas tetramitiformis]|uniref:UTP23 sensor motif region domain-containing protein n=1 Tax=Cymbomonas tetramitiformis TaxID=36881 RepID=A0AAE0L0I7_9CHLO|nr:hypothetical protein CYMTET_24002 [Cymbomonas tetramitiformis]
MKYKKQKSTRRNINFFRVQCGFREPFRVIIDGNFLHALLEAKLGGPREILPKFLGATTVKPYVTRCVLAELRSLGEDFTGTALAARRIETMRCNHLKPVSPSECLCSLVGENNGDCFFIATQQQELREKLLKVPNVPILFACRTSLNLEPPSEVQKRLCTEREVQQKTVPQHELKAAPLRTLLESAETNSRKRKKVKGVNPLACKKKKADSEPMEVKVQAAEGKQKRKRQRGKHKESGLNADLAAAVEAKPL